MELINVTHNDIAAPMKDRARMRDVENLVFV